jgi:ABC-2 type transport system permease protein
VPIFDQGYQHWSGHLSGHAWRWLAITRQGVRSGLKSRILRVILLVAWVPALLLTVFLCAWGLLEQNSELVTGLLSFLGPQVLTDPRSYRIDIWTISYNYFLMAELQCSMFLMLLVGPTLISQDLRLNALPLYFSRPLRRVDYFLGKLGVIVVFLGLVLIVPAVIAYGLGLLFSLDSTILWDTFPILLGSVGFGLVIAVSAGTLMLALSSLSRNSRYVALMWVGIWALSGATASMLQAIDYDQRRHEFNRGLGDVSNDVRRARAEDFQQESLEFAKTDWRPLISYTANLARVGQHFLGTAASWERLSQLQPGNRKARFLRDNAGTKYPWYWSAAVLAGLFGVSVCLLNFRIKSLDRLK